MHACVYLSINLFIIEKEILFLEVRKIFLLTMILEMIFTDFG